MFHCIDDFDSDKWGLSSDSGELISPITVNNHPRRQPEWRHLYWACVFPRSQRALEEPAV